LWRKTICFHSQPSLLIALFICDYCVLLSIVPRETRAPGSLRWGMRRCHMGGRPWEPAQLSALPVPCSSLLVQAVGGTMSGSRQPPYRPLLTANARMPTPCTSARGTAIPPPPTHTPHTQQHQ
jgi:hypothetical protein